MFIYFRTFYYQISFNPRNVIKRENFLNGYSLAIIDCSWQNESNQKRYRRECIREYYSLLPHLTWSHVRIQPVVQCSAQDHINYDICKCLRFLNIRDITKKKEEMFYDGAYSRRIVRYGRLWICKDSALGGDLPWRKWQCWEKGLFSHITFLRAPYHGIFLQNSKSSMLLGWLQITMDCSGKTEWSHIVWRNAWLQ